MLKHADLHVVEANLSKALFPINALRNLAIDTARTNYVWLIEGDMLVPAGVRDPSRPARVHVSLRCYALV